MNAATFCEHFATFAEAPNGVAKLRELILQLAVQGQLVPQDPNDELAMKLLERIAVERQRMESDEGARVQKALPPISPDEIPYQLPAGWVWERLGNIGETNIGLTYSPEDVCQVGAPVLRSSNIQNGKIDLADLVRVAVAPKESVLVAEGDLLICARNGSRALVGKVALIENLSETTAFGAFMAIFRSGLNQYLYHFICSPLFRRVISDVNTTTINQITQSNLRSTLAPIPPLAEQRRIVGRVDQLLGLCDELAARQAARRDARTALVGATLDRLVSARSSAEFPAHAHRLRDHFDRLFDTPTTIPQLRQAILQLAVQGQLVPQEPNDEPATLQPDDDEDRKRGATPTDSEPTNAWPFDIPANWRWLRLRDTPVTLKYGTSVKCEYEGNGVPVLRIPNVVGGRIDLTDLKYGELTEKEQSDLRLQKGDLLLIRSNGSTGIVGRTAVVDDNAIGLVRVRYPAATWFPEFLHLAMISQATRDQIEGPIRTTSGVKNINSTEIGRLMLPLPPLSEQKRIVSKVTELLSMCDALEAKLTQADSANAQLLSAAVHHLLRSRP